MLVTTGKVQGIFCPNMVPLDPSGAVNETELRRLIDFLIERGISGLYPNGSTGEFIRFDLAERRRIIEIACEQADRAGRPVPVLAGAAEAHIDLTVDTLNYYADLGCRAGALIAPHYYKVGQDNVRAYFEELAERSRLDIILYHIPQFANEISIPAIVSLCQHPRIVGIKDSQRDLPRFLNTIAKVRPLRPDFSFLIGCEEILLPSLVMGADGGTVATAGVVPETVMKIYDLYRAGRIDEAARVQYRLLELIELMLTGVDFPEGFRAGMAVRGFDMGRGRQPQSAAAQLDIERITRRLLSLLGERGLADETARPSDAPGVDDAVVREIIARVVAQIGG